MCNVTGRAFTDANPFACKYIINIHKVIVGCHSKIFPSICTEKGAVNIKAFHRRFDFQELSMSKWGKGQGNNENSPLL